MKDYSDIIDHPHYQSRTRPHMSMLSRAAQFAPFAALTGYDDAVRETARLTDDRLVLMEDALNALDEALQEIGAHLESHPEVTVSYFKPDEHKSGGEYLSVTGRVMKIDDHKRQIKFEDGTAIPLKDILDIYVSDPEGPSDDL